LKKTRSLFGACLNYRYEDKRRIDSPNDSLTDAWRPETSRDCIKSQCGKETEQYFTACQLRYAYTLRLKKSPTFSPVTWKSIIRFW